MKTTIRFCMMGLFAIAFLANCGTQLNEQEKKMVGVWNCTGYEEEDETDENYRRTLTYDNSFEYKADRTLTQRTICNERVYVNEEDYDNIITFEWEITGSGTWSIEGNQIIEKLNECDINLKKIRTAVKNDDDQEYVLRLKATLEDEIPDWRNSYLKKEENKVIYITDSKFLGEDEEGDEIELIRVK